MLKINQELIDPELVDDAFHRIKSEYELKSQESCCSLDGEFFAQAEEEVVLGTLLAQEAEKRYPQIPADTLRDAFEQTIKEWRNHGASWDLIDSQRVSLREETAAILKMKLFADEVCQHLAEPDEAACFAYFNENRQQFYQAPGARVWHLLRFPDAAAPWVEHQHMVEIREKVLAGADFPTLAAKHTSKLDKNVDLGWIDMEQATNPFECIVFSLRPGELSPIISYENAFHLVMIAEIRAAVQMPFAEQIASIRLHLQETQRREVLKSLAIALRQQASIERISTPL